MTKAKFGIDQIQNPQPKWAKNMFRIVLYTASVGTLITSSFPQIADHVKVLIAQSSGFLILVTHLFSKGFGIDIADIEPPKK